MKIGYIASDIHRLTFELNEVFELLRQHPDARIYSFYGLGRGVYQEERFKQIPAEVLTFSLPSALKGFLFLAFHCPFRLGVGAVILAFHSLSNPFYWIKNFLVFCVAMPVLADAARRGVTHLHANFGSSPATIAWLGRKILGTGLSMTFHAFDIYDRRWAYRDPLKRKKLQDSNFVVAVHEDGRRVLSELGLGLDQNKFKVLRICVQFAPKPKPALRSEPPLVLAAGNLVTKKGFHVLIRAVGILKRRGVPLRLRILGEGGERQALEDLVQREDLRDRVSLPGYFQHHELAGHLAEASVFAMPSLVTPDGDRDGIPTVVVEAWLSGTPVVASLVGGMQEVVVDQFNALAFDPGDAEALAVCLGRLLADRKLQRSLADQGIEKAKKDFCPEKNVATLLGEIRSCSSLSAT